MSVARGEHDGSGPDGLAGQWLSLDELGEIELFRGSKRAFKVKLNANLGAVPDRKEPGIKAVVRREYRKGDIICRAGEYGSTAFLILEGSASAALPEHAQPARIAGRTTGSIRRLTGLFRRRSHAPAAAEPGEVEIGEVSAYATLTCPRPPLPARLAAGDLFGIDTCINFYPREATVRAEERCVVIEMLRSVLDTIREAGNAAGAVDASYRQCAIRNTLQLNPLFAHVGDEAMERLIGAADLLTNDSDAIHNNVIYGEGEPAQTVYLVRAGTIRLSQKKAGGELTFTYLGRGSMFGLEAMLPARQTAPLVLSCISHPNEISSVELKGTLTVGRSAACEVVLPKENRAVGRRHCRIEERQGDLYLVDLDSANFTLLNGERIREAILAQGDRITVVDYVFEVSRASLTVTGTTPLRWSSASGLDNFEIVALRAEDLLRLARSDPRLYETAHAAARSLEASSYRRPVREQALLSELIDLNLYNSQNTLLIDLERCTRCDECVRACADAHGGVTRFTRDGPRFGKYLVTMACRSCTDPKCMIGCPVSSIRRTASLEVHIESWCIGCQRCANQCPFGNINMTEVAEPAPASPDAPALKAVVCDLCSGYDGPSCVYACPHDAAIRVNPSRYLSVDDLR